MGAVFGLIGHGSLNEVRAMGEYLRHRGAGVEAWSPAAGVYFGTRGTAQPARGPVALDAQLDDEAVDLAALLASGLNGLKTVNGYFALAFHDVARKSVVLACDTSGFKSLYYTFLPGRIAFASEYKALLALADFHPRLDLKAAQHYLATRSFRMDRPLMAEVFPVAAGAACRVTADLSVLQYRYWTATPCHSGDAPEDLANELRAALERTVARQVGRFSRVAITLSGGLDSACVLALLRRVAPHVRVDSYTIGHGPEDPDCAGAREVAALYGTVHHELTFDPEQVAKTLPGLIWLMEDCAGREEALLQHLVMREAAKSAPVVFGGYGADVLFGGMPRYRLIRMCEAWPALAPPLREVFQFTQTAMPPRTPLGRLAVYLLYGDGGFPPPLIDGAGGPVRVADDLGLDAFIAEQFGEAQDSGYLEPSLEVGGAEFRDPFQATEIMNLALRMPGRLNVGLLQQKRILRRALSDVVPPFVRRRGKSLQRVRHDLALSRALDQLADRLLRGGDSRTTALVGTSYLQALRGRPPNEPYSSERLYRLWTLLCLELWQRQFLEGKSRLGESLTPEPGEMHVTLESAAA